MGEGGARVGTWKTDNWHRLPSDALRVIQGPFQHFRPNDDTLWILYPYCRLKAFEREEDAAGGPPLFVTATYQGQKSPVFFWWSVGYPNVNQAPDTSPGLWDEAVNFRDDRFIKFWINEFVRSTAFRPIPGTEASSGEGPPGENT
jgi:hypothetical protein